MRTKLGRVIDALLDRQAVRVAPNIIALPDGSEYVRIERPRSFRAADMPTENLYLDDDSQATRREAAMTLLDEDTHGFLLITLKAGRNPPGWLIAQVRPEWRPYLGGILGGILRQYAGPLGRAPDRSRR